MKHLPIGGSTAARTIACPSWLERAKKVPKPKSSIYADEGNLLHDAMESHYSFGTPFLSLVGELKYAGLTLTHEHLPLLDVAKAATEEVLNKHHIDIYTCEPFVQIEKGVSGGSIDFLGKCTSSGTVVLLDYKFGSVPVSPKNNAQLMFYALAASIDPLTEEYLKGMEHIVYVIVQPKVHTEPQVWESDNIALHAFEEKLNKALANPNKAATGPHCSYCPAAPVCPDKKQQAASALIMPLKTAKEVAEALTEAKKIIKWAEQVEEQAQDMTRQGVTLPGYKLVEGRSVRMWNAEGKQWVEELYGEDAYTYKLLSPTQIEKKSNGKLPENYSDFVVKPTGKPTLAPEKDKREAIQNIVTKSLKDFVDNKK